MEPKSIWGHETRCKSGWPGDPPELARQFFFFHCVTFA